MPNRTHPRMRQRKLRPIGGYATVEKLWPGETFVCIASGPSLTPEDVNFVRGKARVIAINDNWKLAPWADVLYCCDTRMWNRYKGVPEFTGLKYALTRDSSRWKNVRVLRDTGEQGLELDPSGLRSGKNSGHQAIGLAVHLGASRIVLLGYDMQRTNGKDHWFGPHQWPAANLFSRWLRNLETLVEPLQKLGIEVVNCTRITALECFPKANLQNVFRQEAAA